MEKIILASHGSLANGMASAIEVIVGKDPRVKAFSLDNYESPSRILEEVKKELDGTPTVIVCDIKGGSIHNQLMELCNRPDVYLITGMNLGLVLYLVSSSEEGGLMKLCKDAMKVGVADICFYDREFVQRKLSEQRKSEL